MSEVNSDKSAKLNNTNPKLKARYKHDKGKESDSSIGNFKLEQDLNNN
jgi:hypothetical protein